MFKIKVTYSLLNSYDDSGDRVHCYLVCIDGPENQNRKILYNSHCEYVDTLSLSAKTWEELEILIDEKIREAKATSIAIMGIMRNIPESKIFIL